MKLRIISGNLGGRLINVPKSNLIRPTTNRVRETLFNILNNKINFNDLTVLDIYAGSGALGFECISRGAWEIHFVEKNFVIYKNLEGNIGNLQIEEQCYIFKMSAVKFSTFTNHINYDLILADPPFFKNDIYAVVNNFLTNQYLKKSGRLIIERSIQTKENDIKNFDAVPFKIIGDTCLYEIIAN